MKVRRRRVAAPSVGAQGGSPHNHAFLCGFRPAHPRMVRLQACGVGEQF